jgi:hypothetical protein
MDDDDIFCAEKDREPVLNAAGRATELEISPKPWKAEDRDRFNRNRSGFSPLLIREDDMSILLIDPTGIFLHSAGF